ncbi:MAG: tripartite tricarboxylate transporter TctB family protein [Proteobacteria bacterium]|nr:tripartite tricarboxylate transporter TctB family protein [Pseudomonadota bacterium]
MRSPKDTAAGLFFLIVGIAGYWFVREMPMGAAVRMGPGYIPKVLSVIILLFGVFLAVRSLVLEGEPLEGWKLKPLIVISAAILVFAFLIDSQGLAIASIALMIGSTIGGREFFWREMIIFTILMTIGSAIVFHVLLGLPMTILPDWLSEPLRPITDPLLRGVSWFFGNLGALLKAIFRALPFIRT